jgi:catechol 2,3-dioxygenase-like lactoylglutathione lyase family enzyme
MNVTNLDSVVFGVTDLPACCRFWTDFGLAESTAADGATVFSCKNGSSVVLRDANDLSLPRPIEPGATQREAIFGVKSPADLTAIATELERDRPIRVDADGTVHATDPLGFGIAFRVARRTPIMAPALAFNTPGRPDRINTRGQFFTSATPLEMTHTVFMIDQPDKIVPFYTERLGFIASDTYPGRGYFLRGGASNHHHNLFLLNVGKKPGFHHLAFELSSIHELFGGGLNMTRRGWTTALGPGRHPISSCYFWYFHSPCGGAAEYDFDSDVVDERWVPGQFQQSPEVFAEWCLAEGMADSLLYKGVQTGSTIKDKS